MFEHYYNHPVISLSKFYRRVLYYFGFSTLILIGSLSIGILGYHYLAEMEWIDSLLNASMILTGMRPTQPIHTVSGKLFASFYALFSGLAFLSMQTMLLAPIIHRFLHVCKVDLPKV
jgi:hypothetical protein